MDSSADLLRIEDLGISFAIVGGPIHAVKRANLRVLPGKVTALVGESGSGKSVISQAVMGILPKTANVRGRILFSDPETPGKTADILEMPRDGQEIRSLRGRRIGKIFQEPMTSLSPLHTIGNQISEVLLIHTDMSATERRERTEEMLGLVGFPNPKQAYDMYSFELSGGLRQRAMIAMALICRPALLIADEPTTALDVTIQAQILQLLRDLQTKLNMAMLLITHDLGVVANVADEVVVIYHGEIMEAGPVEAIFRKPSHPYLKGLMAAVPHFDMKPGERLKALREVPVNVENLLGTQSRAAGRSNGRPVVRQGSHQDIHHPQLELVRRPETSGSRRRWRQLRHQARRVPGAGRRMRLRQDHGQQDPDAGADAGSRVGHLQRRRWPDRRASGGGFGAARAAHQNPDGVPGPSLVAVAAHDGPEHPERAAGDPRSRRRQLPAGKSQDR